MMGGGGRNPTKWGREGEGEGGKVTRGKEKGGEERGRGSEIGGGREICS